MAVSPEVLEEGIRAAIAPGFRERLLARGQARAMIWRDGVLPDDAPPFSGLLSYDLLSYGYALLGKGLRLIETDGSRDIARLAFEHAASALEAVVADGPEDEARDFHRLVAAATYHLGRFSARAYSLLREGVASGNLLPNEKCLTHLILRNLDEIESQIAVWRANGSGSDDALVKQIDVTSLGDIDNSNAHVSEAPASDDSTFAALDIALCDGFMAAMGTAMLAFERGERALLDIAITRLRIGLRGSSDFGLVSQWWCHRLTIHLIDELWQTSFHVQLPLSSPSLAQSDWPALRALFIASLYRRARAEIDLWPSQLDAAARALNINENIVVSLPTSAGKTRIAELCILTCLAAGKRVVFVTPLRALSAQTEISLQRTFQPLGKTVSSLYGSIGVSVFDEDILRDRNIIVATPEKLDFALRSDPGLLDDVGLVVLDEGHMIGLGEREVRYEVQIQRLLKRADANTRRIVCLSAILPTGDQLDDFVAWLTTDKPNGLLHNDWRPTRLRFGEVDWRGSDADWEQWHARLNIRVGDEKPFVPKFFTAIIPPIGRRTKPFPKDQRELCLATAWRLVRDGQSVLIFCPERRSVEPYATVIVDLWKRGALESVLEQNLTQLGTALAIGAEWFGLDHVILQCLKLGVAIHHGALPTPFRKEVERLLRDGVLKVMVSSPTLAQGLNLSATALIFHGLTRNREVIKSSEFRNVVGRAGRAYIDVEGLVLYPMFDNWRTRRENWDSLISNTAGREMESGLFRLVYALLIRMVAKLGTNDVSKLIEYVANNAAWDFPVLAGEAPETSLIEAERWRGFLTSLDTAILSLLGEQEVADEAIQSTLDVLLQSSLWERRLARKNEPTQRALRAGLGSRAKYIWANSTSVQRRGYFLAGVGLETGLQLDSQAAMLGELLVQANAAILINDKDSASKSIIGFAEVIFKIPPFIPDHLPDDWRVILTAWLHGLPLVDFSTGNEEAVLQFVEQGLVYKLPWGMEAVRVRGLANDDVLGNGFALSDFELGVAVPAVETGSLNRAAALLMQSGFSARLAAIKAVSDTAAEFTTLFELRLWLKSGLVMNLSSDKNWPSVETHEIWNSFVQSLDPSVSKVWKRSELTAEVEWISGAEQASGTPIRIGIGEISMSSVFAADCQHIGQLSNPLNPARKGLLRATTGKTAATINLEYFGPDDLLH